MVIEPGRTDPAPPPFELGYSRAQQSNQNRLHKGES